MSEKRPFDAAIKELEENVFAVTNFLQGCDENNHFPEFIVSQKKRLLELQLAIRVLEAAGKVDKEGGLKFIHACGYPIFPYPKNARQIRALLEALPDKEEK